MIADRARRELAERVHMLAAVKRASRSAAAFGLIAAQAVAGCGNGGDNELSSRAGGDQAPPPPAKLAGPRAVAPGGRLELHAADFATSQLQYDEGAGWQRAAGARVANGSIEWRAPERLGRMRLRAQDHDGAYTSTKRVRVRPLHFAAVGDVNLGDGPGEAIAANGPRFPWTSVGPLLRRSDLVLANLESPVAHGGTPQEKQFVFEGDPSSLPAMHRSGGIDIANLANNHSDDFGSRALLATTANVRRAGMTPVGAGRNAAVAYRPVVLERLGLRVAIVGFSVILPYEFRATDTTPGTAWGFPDQVASAIRAAKREADVVIATFHWGIELQTEPNEEQRQLAAIAAKNGANVITGGHPHVLQPFETIGETPVAWSLGNFVFAANSPETTRTGIWQLALGRDRVYGTHLVPVTIEGVKPVLDG